MRLIWARRPSSERLRAFVADQAAKDLSYADVGATRGELPPGYVHDREAAHLGPFDPDAFDCG